MNILQGILSLFFALGRVRGREEICIREGKEHPIARTKGFYSF